MGKQKAKLIGLTKAIKISTLIGISCGKYANARCVFTRLNCDQLCCGSVTEKK